MAKRRHRCVICGEFIELDSPSIPYKGRQAHPDCFDNEMRELERERTSKTTKTKKETKRTGKKKKNTYKVPELKGAMSEEEYSKKKAYYDYIRSLMPSGEQLSAKIYAISDDYIKRYGFTYESMHKTLIYLHELLEKSLTGDIVGIIPYYHSQAMDYYKNVELIQNNNKDKDIDTMYKETVVYTPKKPRKKLINIENL